jgi:hypothetical protein
MHMSTLVKILLVSAAVFGTYCFLNAYMPATHSFAFGLGGMGFSYLALASAAVGLVAHKAIK